MRLMHLMHWIWKWPEREGSLSFKPTKTKARGELKPQAEWWRPDAMIHKARSIVYNWIIRQWSRSWGRSLRSRSQPLTSDVHRWDTRTGQVDAHVETQRSFFLDAVTKRLCGDPLHLFQYTCKSISSALKSKSYCISAPNGTNKH